MEQLPTQTKQQRGKSQTKRNKKGKPHTKKPLLTFIYRKNGNTTTNL